MKLSNESVEELVKELIGNKAIPLVQLIKEKDNVSEFKLADKLKLTVNQVRSVLYDLSAYSLVSFIRKKDKKKGWYNYFWSFNNKRARELILNMKKEALGILKKRLDIESTDVFFKCPSGCMRMTLENAMEARFKCMECGSVLQEQKTHVNIENTNKEIKKIEQDIEELEKISFVEEEPVKKKAGKAKKNLEKKVKKKPQKKKAGKARKKAKKSKTRKKSKAKKKIKSKKIRRFSFKKLRRVFRK